VGAVATVDFQMLYQDTEAAIQLPDVVLLESKIAEVEQLIQNATTANEKRKARERKEDLMRLQRVEQIYVS
jgi:hypothetical protein